MVLPMTAYSFSLSALLLATSALTGGQAFAQEAVPPAPAASAQADTPEASATDSEGGDVIRVLGSYIPEPLQETSEVAQFLSNLDLERQGDSNAAEALTRVTGLSIAEGKFVYVRGLGERYSSAILNGSPLPSPEPLQRVVPLDLFPSSILQGVMVQKSYSAEFPGEFGGGVIELSTLNLPDYPFLEVGVGVSANSETSFETGYTYNGGEADRFGFDDGVRKMPGQLREALATGKRINGSNFTPAQLQRIGQSFENAKTNLVQVNHSIPANGSADLSGGYRWDVGGASIGVIGVLGYANDWETQDGIQQEGRIDGGVITPKSDYNYTSTDNKVGWDGLFGAGVEFGRHTIDWTNLWIRRTTKQTYVRFGFDELAGEDVRDDRTAWYERELLSTQLRGSHDFEPLTLSWRAALAETSRNAPYERQIRYLFDDSIDRYLHDTSRAPNRLSFSELSDKVQNFGIDLAYAIPRAGAKDTVISGGLDYSDNTRSSEARSFRFVAEGLPLAVQQTRVDYLFADYNINPDRLVIRETSASDGAAAYDAGLEVSSAYIKADFEPITYVRAALGLRAESGRQFVSPRNLFSVEGTPDQPPAIEKDYLLPAATLTWNFAPDQQIRFGASQTIARPQFRELAPQQYLDPDSDRLFVGNPYLKDSELLNLDSRYEFFFADQQYFTLGAFYKTITNPIESVVVEQGATIQQSYLNAPEARLYGAEIELKSIFDDPFPDNALLKGKSFLIQGNYTYSNSEVTAEAGDVVYPISEGGDPADATLYIVDGSRLQGQSEHVVNLQLGYEDDAANSQATLIATYVSERSSARGRPGEPDYIQEPGVILDLVYRKTFEIGGREVSASVKAGNLLNENYVERQSFGGGEIIINQYDLGRSISFGLSTAY